MINGAELDYLLACRTVAPFLDLKVRSRVKSGQSFLPLLNHSGWGGQLGQKRFNMLSGVIKLSSMSSSGFMNHGKVEGGTWPWSKSRSQCQSLWHLGKKVILRTGANSLPCYIMWPASLACLRARWIISGQRRLICMCAGKMSMVWKISKEALSH